MPISIGRRIDEFDMAITVINPLVIISNVQD